MSTKLKELTWENHQNAERMVVARKLLKGMPAPEYHKFIYNQYVQYEALEVAARAAGMLEGIEGICRAPGMLADMEELEEEFGIERDESVLCPVVQEYVDYVNNLEGEGLIAHIYVRHFGELHGGQMIKKRAPGSGKMYDFVESRALIKETRTRLHDGMADEANRAFEFAMQLFKELEE
mgnify:CR=1 FL=1|jgi:heme oxygenase